MLVRHASHPLSFRRDVEEGKPHPPLFPPPRSDAGSAYSPCWQYLLSSKDGEDEDEDEEEDEEDRAEKALTMCEMELKAIGESIQGTLVQVLHQTIVASPSDTQEGVEEAEQRSGEAEYTSLWEVPLPPSSSSTNAPEMDDRRTRDDGPGKTHDILSHVERILEEERCAIAAARIEVVMGKEEVRARRQYKAMCSHGGALAVKAGWWNDAESLVWAAHSMAKKKKEEEEEEAQRVLPPPPPLQTSMDHASTTHGIPIEKEGGIKAAWHITSTLSDGPSSHISTAASSSSTGEPPSSVPPPPPVSPTPSPGPKMHLSLMTGSKQLLESVVHSVSQSVRDVDDALTRTVINAIRWDGKGKGECENEMMEDDEGEQRRREVANEGETRRTGWWRTEEDDDDDDGDEERKGSTRRGGKRNSEANRKKKNTVHAQKEEEAAAHEEAAGRNTFLASISLAAYTAEETASFTVAHAQLIERQHDIVAEEVEEVEAAVQDLSHLNSLVSEAVWTQREKFSLVMKNTEEAHRNLKKATAELEKPLKKFWNARRQMIALLWWCILTMWLINWLFR